MSSSDSSTTSDTTKPEEAARMDGPNAHVVDQLLGNDHRKRSRPTSGSSLDYHKPEDADATLVSPRQAVQDKQQEDVDEQYHQTTTEDSRPKIATRARGSSGIPPRGKLQLEDLQGMSEDEVMRALYEDPELAAAAAAASQRDTDKPGAGGRTGKTSTTPKVPQGKRVDGLKERGFPFVQWAVLLLLLGLVIHQIYKSMLAPSTTKTRNKKASSKAKSSGKPTKSGSLKHKTKPPSASEDEDVIENEQKAETTTASITKKSPPTLKKKKVKAKKPKAVSSSTAEDTNASYVTEKKPAVVEKASQDDGWTTVGKESDSKPKVEARNGSSKPASKPVESAAAQEAGNATEINEFQPVAAKSKKKNKNKKKQENGASSKHEANSEINGIEGDAALAMQLQQFEQSGLQSEMLENIVDVWEEVKPKKRK